MVPQQPTSQYLTKPSSQLVLPQPKSNSGKMTRSASNPLLSQAHSSETSGEYDLSFIGDDETGRISKNNLNIPQRLPLSAVNSVPVPHTRNNSLVTRDRTNSHRKTRSGNDKQRISTFTLIDALQSLQNERRANDSPKKRNTRHKRRRKDNIKVSKSKDNQTRNNHLMDHASNDSVVSVLHLFAAQGFCSKISVNSVHQIHQLTTTPSEKMKKSQRNLFNISQQMHSVNVSQRSLFNV